MKTSEKLYLRYEHLAQKYARKIFSYEELSFEYEDLLQEFKIKIFTSIKAYGRRYSKYMKGEASKPVPIKYYLEAACSNKVRDFMKYITRENYKVRIDDINYDYGVEDDCEINANENRFVVNGIDLLEGLSGKERIVFSMYLRGYNTNFLRKVYFNKASEKELRRQVKESGDEPIDVTDIINEQCSFLINKYGAELRKARQTFSTFAVDED